MDRQPALAPQAKALVVSYFDDLSRDDSTGNDVPLMVPSC
jgi:hypothetical protein